MRATRAGVYAIIARANKVSSSRLFFLFYSRLHVYIDLSLVFIRVESSNNCFEWRHINCTASIENFRALYNGVRRVLRGRRDVSSGLRRTLRDAITSPDDCAPRFTLRKRPPLTCRGVNPSGPARTNIGLIPTSRDPMEKVRTLRKR